MPTYVFNCTRCGEEFQVKTTWHEKTNTKCPACGSHELKELLGRYAVNVNSGRTNAGIPEKCQGCANPSPGCPMAG